MAKLALVTGHSSGIGKAFAEHLTARGYSVLGASRSNGYDLSTKEGVDRLVKSVGTQSLDLLINNAGQLWLDESDRTREIDRLVYLNQVAPYRLALELPLAPGAVVVNVASAGAHAPDSFVPMYGATKAALIYLTKSLALRLAPSVRVVALSPGFVETDLVDEELPKEVIQKLPLQRTVPMEDLVRALDFILECRSLTGAEIVVDGGFSNDHYINHLFAED